VKVLVTTVPVSGPGLPGCEKAPSSTSNGSLTPAT